VTDHIQTNTNQTYTLRTILILTVLVAGAAAAHSQDVPSNAPYKNAKLPVEQRVQDLLGRMTVEEKASMLAGANWMESVAIPRLGIPSIKMADGPMGIRSWAGPSKITKRCAPFQ
jgi:beta-glucosidase